MTQRSDMTPAQRRRRALLGRQDRPAVRDPPGHRGLFVLYGITVFVAGLLDGVAATRQAAGIDINVWAGLGMFLLGVFFLVWMRLNPMEPPDPAHVEHDRPVQ